MVEEKVKGKLFIAVFLALYITASVTLVGNMTVNPALWSAGPPAAKGGGKKSGGKQHQQPPLVGDGKGKKGAQSNSRKGAQQPVGGYQIGHNTRPRMALEIYPWGNGATSEEMTLFPNESQFPGIAAPSKDAAPGAIPQPFEWIPCLNSACPAPCLQKPPYSTLGIANFAVVSNPGIKCKLCCTQFVPMNTQRVLELFQAVLIKKLGGALGPLHPKFKGSKMYIQAELALGDDTPDKPPLFDPSANGKGSGIASAAISQAADALQAQAAAPMSAASWLNNNQKIPPKTSSAEAVEMARSSLTHLESALLSGEIDIDDLDYRALSRATSAASLHPESNDPSPENSSTGDTGIFEYLTSSIQIVLANQDEAKAAALRAVLEADFPKGRPEAPKESVPPPRPLSPPNELNLLAGKSAQALQALLAARTHLEVCRDQVVACQHQVDQAKELATKASAEVQASLTVYQQADDAVKAFNAKTAAKEAERAAHLNQQMAEVTQPVTPPANIAPSIKSEQEQIEQQQTYAAVVKGKGKQHRLLLNQCYPL